MRGGSGTKRSRWPCATRLISGATRGDRGWPRPFSCSGVHRQLIEREVLARSRPLRGRDDTRDSPARRPGRDPDDTGTRDRDSPARGVYDLRMARKTSVAAPPVAQPMLPPEKALEVLRLQSETGSDMLTQGAAEEQLEGWRTEAQHWVNESFGENSSKAREFAEAGVAMTILDVYAGAGVLAERRREELEGKLSMLKRSFRIPRTPNQTLAITGSDGQATQPARSASSNKVFVVHGHDDGAKDAVARLLGDLGLEPIGFRSRPMAVERYREVRGLRWSRVRGRAADPR